MKPWTIFGAPALCLAIMAELGACSVPTAETPSPVAAVRTAPAETKTLQETITAYGPVSYTHLDVYKRQRLESCDIPNQDKFTLTLFMAIADRERMLISFRTQAARVEKVKRTGLH